MDHQFARPSDEEHRIRPSHDDRHRGPDQLVGTAIFPGPVAGKPDPQAVEAGGQWLWGWQPPPQ
jgi:hypothetical protein